MCIDNAMASIQRRLVFTHASLDARLSKSEMRVMKIVRHGKVERVLLPAY